MCLGAVVVCPAMHPTGGLANSEGVSFFNELCGRTSL